MNPDTEREKGTCHTDILYVVETRMCRGEQPRKYTRQQNVNNRRLLTTLGYSQSTDKTPFIFIHWLNFVLYLRFFH